MIKTNENSITQDKLEENEFEFSEVRSMTAPKVNADSHIYKECQHDDINIVDVIKVLWDGKYFLVSAFVISAAVSIFYSLSLPNIYKSEALLAPVEERAVGGLAGLSSQFGGLASLAGVELGGNASDKTTLAIELLKSRDFIFKFIEKYDLLVPLMAAKGWDYKTNKLIIDPDIYSLNEKKWVREVNPPKKIIPSLQEAAEVYRDYFSIVQDDTTNYVLIRFKFFSPELAQAWVTKLVYEINLEVKSRDVKEAEKSVGYLNEQLKKTSVSNMREVFYGLIEEQIKTIMFAQIRDEYVFKIIDSPIVEEKKAEPNRAILCLVITMFGFAISSIFLLARHFLLISQ